LTRRQVGGGRGVDRRAFLALGGAFLLRAGRLRAAEPGSLRTAPLELAGDWGGTPRRDATVVLNRIRGAALAGVRLVSDRQPRRLRVENRSSGLPAVWLHDEPADTAWVIVDIGPADWSKLAYQFGHELGHVLCNSWARRSTAGPPCQWLEEAMVKAFSIRGLGLLAASWEADPPFPGNAAFGEALRRYRRNIIDNCRDPAVPAGTADLAGWFRSRRARLEAPVGSGVGPAIVAIAAALDRDGGCVEDLGATNRWPGRVTVPLPEYLSRWEASCAELGAPGRLPRRLRMMLGVQ
jgi:hypothetical protein